MNLAKKSWILISWIIMVVMVMIFSMAGCGAFEGVSSEAADNYGKAQTVSRTEAAMEEPAMDMEMAEEAYIEEEAASGIDEGYSDTPQVIDRKIIKTAYMELEVAEGQFEKILFELTSLAERNGGYISNTQSYSDEEGNLTSGSISIRIPHDNYNSAIDKIKSMGTVKSISISGQDVTQEYVDLESRLRNQQAQEEVLLDLMAQSGKVSDSLEVQRELSYVQEQIEMIKGRMNYLDNMVSYSTIDVYLFEPEPITTTTGWGFLEALKRGLRGAVTVFNGIVMFVVAVSPILVVLAIIGVIIWLIVRAKRRRRARSGK
jgi:hypothetical protein